MLDQVEPTARIEPGPGQESVWDYPRPPRVEDTAEHVVGRLGGETVADTRRARRVLETSQAPAYYLPPDDVRHDLLVTTDRTSWCEFKGVAHYADVVVGRARLDRAAWSYRHPTAAYASIAWYVAFYPHDLTCTIDGALVRPMPGGFYGGWVTDRVVGPFKGASGTEHW